MREYVVTFREPAIVTELVEASNAREAIEKVKDGLGQRVGFDIDERVYPTCYKAVRNSPGTGGD